MCSQRDRPEPACNKSYNLESPPLRANVNNAQNGEAREGAGVVQALAGPAAPALPTGDEAGVSEEKEEGEPVRYACSDWSAKKTEADGVNEKVIQAGADGRGDEEDVGTRAHDFYG